MLYPEDEEFRALYGACQKLPKEDYLIQEGFLFKGTRLCVPRYSIRELLIREVHSGSLASHFGENKTLAILNEHYFWPGMSKDVLDLLKRRATC